MNRLLLCALFLAGGTLCPASVILSINPISQTLATGSPVSVDIDVSGLGNGTALGTYDLNLGFDPTLLSYASIMFGAGLDVLGLGDIQSVTPGDGTVEVFKLSLDSATDLNSLQASSFRLVTLTFDTLAAGIDSPLALSINAVGDAYGNTLHVTLQDASVTIGGSTPPATVPEPSFTLAVGASLVLICALSRLRRLPRFEALKKDGSFRNVETAWNIRGALRQNPSGPRAGKCDVLKPNRLCSGINRENDSDENTPDGLIFC